MSVQGKLHFINSMNSADNLNFYLFESSFEYLLFRNHFIKLCWNKSWMVLFQNCVMQSLFLENIFWKLFIIFISDKLRNELIDFEYQKRYKATKVTESVDITHCILLDDERILSSHEDTFLRLWSTSDCECFINWFSLILECRSYKLGWWMLKWTFVCPPFCLFIYFFLSNLQMPKEFSFWFW